MRSTPPKNVSYSTVVSQTAAEAEKNHTKGQEVWTKINNYLHGVVWTGLADLRTVTRRADNDVLQKVTTCGLSFDWSTTSIYLQHGNAWLPACPLVDRARRWPLDHRVSAHFQVTGWPPQPDSPTTKPENFVLHRGRAPVKVQPVLPVVGMSPLIWNPSKGPAGQANWSPLTWCLDWQNYCSSTITSGGKYINSVEYYSTIKYVNHQQQHST